MSEFGIVMTAGAGVAINTVHTIQTGHSPFGQLFAGSLWIGACVLVGESNGSIGAAMAGVYLLAVLLTRGVAFFTFINSVSKGAQAK